MSLPEIAEPCAAVPIARNSYHQNSTAFRFKHSIMTSSSSKIPVSVLIPAKDEELNLPACLASIARADEVFMVDSQSSDRTVEIAISTGAKVVQFYFDNRWQKKKNWSLDNLPFRNEWVLIVDCDERIPPELWDEIARAIEDPNFDGYYLNRKVFFLGQWLRYGGQISRLEFAFVQASKRPLRKSRH